MYLRLILKNLQHARCFVPCAVLLSSLVGILTEPIAAQGTQKPPPPLTAPAQGSTEALPLASPNVPVRETVPRFIDWAARSRPDQREEVRKMIAASSANSGAAEELCREISETQNEDHSRTLIMLSVLGEMRNSEGEKCLIRFIHLPLPTKGTVVNGEIIEQTSLATLQGKAVDGLAYARSVTADRELLWAVSSHASKIVRAEAINAYLWNHQDSEAARAALLKVVRPNERDLIDRPRHEPGTTREQFNGKLIVYAKMHPAPEPQKRNARKLSAQEGVGDGPPPEAAKRSPTTPPKEKQ